MSGKLYFGLFCPSKKLAGMFRGIMSRGVMSKGVWCGGILIKQKASNCCMFQDDQTHQQRW